MIWTLNLGMGGPEDFFDRILLEIPEPGDPVTTIAVDDWGMVFENFANAHRGTWRVHALVEVRPDGSKKLVASTFLGYLLVYKWGRKITIGQ